jgi:hypothetical protein
MNRLVYGTFVLLSIYFIAANDLSTAVTNLGIALAFDPFNQKVAWNKRPSYQRIWLISHLIMVFGLISILVYKGM